MMPIYLPPISRRSFLKGSLAASAGRLLGNSALAAEAPKKDLNRFALISDIHVGSRRTDTNGDVKPAETFAATVKQVLALDPLPGTVIITGDLAYVTGEPDNYKLVKELFKPIREAGIPLHLILGNHDHREHFWATFPEVRPAQSKPADAKSGNAKPVEVKPAVAKPANSKTTDGNPDAAKLSGGHVENQTSIIETPLANWFLMDSLIATKLTPGMLGKEQLDWLARQLDARKDKPALLIAHHQLSLSGGLLDYAALLDVAAPRRQAKAYFHGHTHCWKVDRQREIHSVNVPATAWLFDPKQPRGWLDLRLAKDGATIVMNALDKKHPKHGEKVELKWRA
jgi:3',5'-cyclic AMP phosphodiesterase CpdA